MRRSLPGKSAAVVAQMPLKIPSLHEATLRVTDSLPGGCSIRKLLVGSEQNVECTDDVC